MRVTFPKIFVVFLLNFFGFVFSQNIDPKPNKIYPVYDKVGLLNSEEKYKLNEKLIKYSDSTSTEIAVIILPNTGGEDINFLATQYGEKWGIGKKDVNNGVVFLISVEDRSMSIQQGRAVEQYLTASTAGQILDYIVSPSFKRGHWYEGIDKGTTAIMEVLRGKFHKSEKQIHKANNTSALTALIIIVVLIIIIMNKSGKGGKKDNDDHTGLHNRDRIIFFPGSYRGGRGFSRSGGFGGFGGGGSFGGGGASGNW